MHSVVEDPGIIGRIRQVDGLYGEPQVPEVVTYVVTLNQRPKQAGLPLQHTRHAGEIVITTASGADLVGLRNLQKRCFQDGQAYGVVTLLVFHLWPKSHVLVARRGEDILGCVIGDAQRDQARVLNVCVDPVCRRQGLGSALLNAIEDLLDHDNVTLMVEDKNLAAQALYRRHGYLSAGDLRDYYGRNRHGMLMQKRRVHPPIGYRPTLHISNGRDE